MIKPAQKNDQFSYRARFLLLWFFFIVPMLLVGLNTYYPKSSTSVHWISSAEGGWGYSRSKEGHSDLPCHLSSLQQLIKLHGAASLSVPGERTFPTTTVGAETPVHTNPDKVILIIPFTSPFTTPGSNPSVLSILYIFIVSLSKK